MSVDADMISICECVKQNGGKVGANCTICEGVGYYFDLVIDQNGSPTLVKGVNKVAQEIIHHFTTDEGDYVDYGYPEYGSRLRRFIGAKNLNENQVRFQVLRDLQYLTEVKEIQHSRFGNITSDEVMRQIIAVDLVNTVDEQSVGLSAIVGDEENPQYLKLDKFVL